MVTGGRLPLHDGTAVLYGGNLYAKNIVTVEAAHFHSGEASLGMDFYATGSASTLVLGQGVVGTIRMNAGKELLTSAVYGGAIENITCSAANALLTDLKKNPKRYVHFSIFGGKSK